MDEWECPECTGCGYCCVSVTCGAGQVKYGEKRPCKGLIWNAISNRHFCKLCLGETKAAYAYQDALHVGAGCCSSLNSWRRKPLKDRTKTKSNTYPLYIGVLK
jgi:hypothetical protein